MNYDTLKQLTWKDAFEIVEKCDEILNECGDKHAEIYPTDESLYKEVLKRLQKNVSNLGEELEAESLEDYINDLKDDFPDISYVRLARIALKVSRFQKRQLKDNVIEARVVESANPASNNEKEFMRYAGLLYPANKLDDILVAGKKVKVIFLQDYEES